MGKYTVVASNVTLPGACTLVWINPPASGIKEIEVCRVEVNYHANANSEQVRYQLVKQPTSFPTLTSATPQPLDQGSPTSAIVGNTTGAAGTCGINASAEGAGSKVILWAGSFNTLNGLQWFPLDEDERIVLPAGSANGFGLYLPAAPATLTGWTATVVFDQR